MVRCTHVAPVNHPPLQSIETPMTRPAPYHHGNLPQTLLDSALQLIAEVGPVGFTLREVARRAGVSHNAPYRHFRDKEDLMAAVAAQGYQELNDAMLEGAAQASNPLGRLHSAGLAYIAFALKRPQHFAVMFEAPFPEERHPVAAQAAKTAFSTLMSLVQAAQDAQQLPEGRPADQALLAWSMVHGVAKLAITGRLPWRSRAAVMKFAKLVIEQSMPSRLESTLLPVRQLRR